MGKVGRNYGREAVSLQKKGYEERVALHENLKVVRRKEAARSLKEAKRAGRLIRECRV